MKKLLVLAVSVMSLNAVAGSGTHGISLGGGTLGANVSYVHRFNDTFSATAGINFLKADYDERIDGADYDGHIDFQSFQLTGNYHPFKNNFRLSAGFLINNNELDVESNGNLEIGDNTYANTYVDAKADFKKFTPYAGIGYGFQHKSGLGLSLDAGVTFQGSPDVKLTTTNSSVMASDLAKEQARVQDKVDDFKYYPVLSLGVHYLF